MLRKLNGSETISTSTLPHQRSKIRQITFCLAMLAFLTALTAQVVLGQAVVYDAIPGTLAPNYASQPFQAQQVAEFGDYVHLAGTNRVLKTVTFTMSDWAKKSDYPLLPVAGWDHPFTVKVYNVVPGSPNTAGSLIGSITQMTTVPWRPEPTITCGTAWLAADGLCYNGYAFNLTVDMSSLGVSLPNDVIVTISFNTNTWGYTPVGSPGPYDSLNVSLTPGPASVGTDDNNDRTFMYASLAAAYSGPGATNVFREDTGWTAAYGTLPIQVTAGPANIVKVTSASLNNWLFYNDNTDVVDNNLGSFVNGPAAPAYGAGSAQISVTGTDRVNLATYQFTGTVLSDIDVMSFRTYNPSAGNGGSATRSAYLNFNVDFNGSDTWQQRLVFLPVDNGGVTQNNWKAWDTINGGNALWRYSGATWPGGGSGAIPKTWNQILSQYPGIRMRVTDSHLGIRVGEPYNSGYTENIDSFSLGTGSGTTTFDFEPLPTLVDDDGMATATNCDAGAPGSASTTIQGGIAAGTPGGIVKVCPGNYNEDINVNVPNLTLLGSGIDVSTITGQHLTGGPDTVLITAAGVTVDGFTITRTGNTVADWNANTQNQGVNVAASAGVTLQNNKITGNRNGIYVGQSSNNTVIRRNVIDFNRTGIHVVDNNGALIEENFVTNNWTVGLLYRTEGGPPPTSMTVRNNRITGNWYSEIEFREPATGGFLNMSGNYLGGNVTRTTAATGEPGYTAQIPVLYGGAATPPPTHPTMTGAQSGRIDYSPLLVNGTDTQVGTTGFQGDYSSLVASSDSAQAGPALSSIQEAINAASSGGTVTGLAGSYPGNVNVNKAVTLQGSFTVGGTLTTSNSSAVVSPGNSPGIINSGNLSLSPGSDVNIELNGTTAGTFHDQLNVTGSVALGGATLNVTTGYSTAVGHSFVIVNNDGADAVSGTFAGLPQGQTFVVSGATLQISYTGGSNSNDVVLTVTAVSCVDVSTPVMTSLTSYPSLTGVAVTIPVTTTSLTGRGVISADFTFNYNSTVLDPTPASITVTPGTVLSGSTVINVNKSVAGTIVVSVFENGGGTWTGAGTLVNINMRTIGAQATSSPLTLNGFTYNNTLVCSNVSSGTLSVISGTVSGKVLYENALVPGPTPQAPDAPRPIPNVTFSSSGVTSSVTALDGLYSLSGFGPGPHTVTPSKPAYLTYVPNGIFSNDPALISQHVVGLITLSPTQIKAGKVSELPNLSSFEAALIAQYIVGIPSAINKTGQWRFTPVNRTYPNIIVDIPNEDYTAILLGDVSGDWNPLGARPAPALTDPERIKKAVTATVTGGKAPQGSVVTVPFAIDNLRERTVGSYQFDIQYDPAVITPASVAADIAGTMSEGLAVAAHSPEAGLLKVVVYGAMPITGDGVYVNLRFVATGTVGSTTDLSINGFRINEGTGDVYTRNGQLTVVPGEKQGVRGRLLSAYGEPVAATRVSAVSTTGARMSAVSDADGYFRFATVVQGETYTITVSSKLFTFAQRTISVTDAVTEVVIIAEQ